MPWLYMITNRSNGKSYVGWTSRKSVETRWNSHRKSIGSEKPQCRLLALALRKHGSDAFDWDVIAWFDTAAEALQAEIYWIMTLNTNAAKGGHGYNLTDGGGGLAGHHHSEETRRKMSEAARGHKHTPEARLKMSTRRKGHPGRLHSAEAKLKNSQAAKAQWEQRRLEGKTGRLGKDY